MKCAFLLFAALLMDGAVRAEFPDISSVAPDLTVPPLTAGAPAPGARVKQFLPEFEGTPIYHVLYLPTDWKPGARYPIIVEYAGNGGFTNGYGDISTGLPEGSKLGYGISGGTNFIWLCLPFVNAPEKKIATQWWGDVDATVAYCKKAVRLVCNQFGGDPANIILCGFSRGAIACGYIGLHDDEIAGLWRAFIPYSHYDGVLRWPYPASDAASAVARLRRLHGRPTFVCQEGTVAATKQFIVTSGVQAAFTFQAVPFRNHNDAWTLRPSPARTALRAWLRAVLQKVPSKQAAQAAASSPGAKRPVVRVDVKQCGATGDGVADDTAAIQRALQGGQRVVVIPSGTYKISAALKVESDTLIQADERAVIRLADHAGTNANVFLLTNRNPEAGNTDICVAGGVWDGNNACNPRGHEGDQRGYTGTAINFINVRRLTLRHLTVRNPEAFSIRLCKTEDFVVEDICFDHTCIRPNQDGVHLNGFCRHGVIRNLRALTPRTTNDDMVALNADDATDRVINLGMLCGPIRDITVENLHADEAYTFVRLLSFKQPIENITISNISGGCRVYAINLDRWRFPAGGGHIHNVTLRNFTIRKMPDSVASAFAKMPLIPIQSAIHGLRIENFRRVDDLPAPTLVLDNGWKNDLHLAGQTGTLQTNAFGKISLPTGGFSLLTLETSEK